MEKTNGKTEPKYTFQEQLNFLIELEKKMDVILKIKKEEK